MAAEYEIIAAQLLRVNSRNHAAWNEWGRGIFDEALRMPPEIAEPMLTDAGRKFAVASDLSPGNAVYWQNRGAALLERAKRDTTGTPLPLFEEASTHYERSIRLSSRQSEAWKGAALCYMERAMRAGAKECGSLYDDAFVRFAVLAELSPGNHDTWQIWGRVLLDCAQKLDNERSLPLLIESIEKSERAFLLLPDALGPLNHAALALHNLAVRLPDAPAAPRWLAEADAKLRQGIALAPDADLLWANRGMLLLTRSRRREARSAQKELLAEADALLLVAHRLAPDSHQRLLNWGNVFTDLGTIAPTDEEAVAHYAEADAKFRACVEIEPGVALYWTNWGILHTLWALDGDSERSSERRQEACEKFAVADSLYSHALNNLFGWSDILCYQAKFAEDDRQFALFLDEAESKCQKAEKIQPGSYQVCLVSGNIFVRKAYRETDPAKRESLLLQARRKYQDANEIDPSKGVYDMACVAAMRASPDDCRSLLEDGLARDVLPPRRRILRDDDLRSVRDEEWFRQLLTRLPR